MNIIDQVVRLHLVIVVAVVAKMKRVFVVLVL